MTWGALKNNLYNWDGSWRDIHVKDCDVSDWKLWSEFINDSYKLVWYNPAKNFSEDTIDFSVICDQMSNDKFVSTTVNFWITESIQVNAHFFTQHHLENDIDPREFRSIVDHDALVNYMVKLSKILSKKVYLTSENMVDHILMIVDGDDLKYGPI